MQCHKITGGECHHPIELGCIGYILAYMLYVNLLSVAWKVSLGRLSHPNYQYSLCIRHTKTRFQYKHHQDSECYPTWGIQLLQEN